MVTTLTDEWRFVPGPGVDDPLVGLYRTGPNAPRLLYFITDGSGRQLMVSDSAGLLTSLDVPGPGSPRGHWRYAGATSSANTFEADRLNPAPLPSVSLFRNRAYDQKSGRWTQEDPIGFSGGLNLFRFNQNNPVVLRDPFGLQPECEIACQAGLAFKRLFGKVVDVLAGDAPAAIDLSRRQPAGSTRSAMTDALSSPPDIGRVDISATLHAGPFRLSSGSGGKSLTFSGFALGVTADATYTRPGAQNGNSVNVGPSGSIGLALLGASANFSNGTLSGGSVSGGVGIAIPTTRITNLREPAQRILDYITGFVSAGGPVD